MIELTEEQRQALHTSKDPVSVVDPQTQEAYVLLRAETYERLKQLLEDEEDRQEQKAWLDLATKTRRRWVEENPY
jgi:PHD/YefM family antitoxin component YafN of YafNO toxin-antitoxin module